ncbi:MAG TPA: hypothetical protein VG935_02905 [Patescibacteria group bacterium]|nr:hypothetical protein [Patescibacteria group bacterium]
MNNEIVPFVPRSEKGIPRRKSAEDTQTSSDPRAEGIAWILKEGSVAPRSVVRRNRFYGGPFIPVDVVSSEPVSLNDSGDRFEAVYVEHQLTRRASLEVVTGRNTNPMLTDAFGKIEYKTAPEVAERELEQLDRFDQATTDYHSRLAQNARQHRVDPNLRYAIPTPPTSSLYERMYSRPNGIGWSRVHERVGVRVLTTDGRAPGAVEVRYLEGKELDDAIGKYHTLKGSPELQNAMHEKERTYKAKFSAPTSGEFNNELPQAA